MVHTLYMAFAMAAAVPVFLTFTASHSWGHEATYRHLRRSAGKARGQRDHIFLDALLISAIFGNIS